MMELICMGYQDVARALDICMDATHRLIQQIQELQQMVEDLRAEKAGLESQCDKLMNDHAETLRKEKQAGLIQIEAAEGHIERHRERAMQMRDERDKAEARAKAKETQVCKLLGHPNHTLIPDFLNSSHPPSHFPQLCHETQICSDTHTYACMQAAPLSLTPYSHP